MKKAMEDPTLVGLKAALAVNNRNLARFREEEKVFQHRFGSSVVRSQRSSPKPTRRFQVSTEWPDGKLRGSYVVQMSDSSARDAALNCKVKPYAIKEGAHHNPQMGDPIAVRGFGK